MRLRNEHINRTEIQGLSLNALRGQLRKGAAKCKARLPPCVQQEKHS